MAVCFRLVVLLVHLVMGASAGSNLRQMGDADYLAVLLTHLLHDICHAVGYLAGNSGIYFVEYNGGELDSTSYHCFNGEHDAGYFTTRSYRGDALQCPVLIRREQEVHSIRPMYARLLADTYLYLKTDIGHAQRYQPRSHLLLHFASSGNTRLGEDDSLLFHLII